MRVIWPAPSHMILTPWQFFLKTMLIYIPNSWSVQPYPWLKLVIPYRFTWSFSIPKIRSRLRVRRKNLRRRESNWMHRQGIWSPGCRTLSSASTQSTTNTSSEREDQPVSENNSQLRRWRCRRFKTKTWWNSHARRLIRLPHEPALQRHFGVGSRLLTGVLECSFWGFERDYFDIWHFPQILLFIMFYQKLLTLLLFFQSTRSSRRLTLWSTSRTAIKEPLSSGLRVEKKELRRRRRQVPLRECSYYSPMKWWPEVFAIWDSSTQWKQKLYHLIYWFLDATEL